MDEVKIVPQKEFETLEEFIEGMNNYWAHFLRGNPFGEVRRNKPHFTRFQQQHLDMERETTEETTNTRKIGQELPYEKLWEAYKLMSEMVYEDDGGVKEYSAPDQYLTA